MAGKITPELEQWYLDSSRHCKFHIIDINLEYLELEYSDGELEQVNISEWETWPLKKVSEPSEWVELASDDYDLDASVMDESDWEDQYPDLADGLHYNDD